MKSQFTPVRFGAVHVFTPAASERLNAGRSALDQNENELFTEEPELRQSSLTRTNSLGLSYFLAGMTGDNSIFKDESSFRLFQKFNYKGYPQILLTDKDKQDFDEFANFAKAEGGVDDSEFLIHKFKEAKAEGKLNIVF